MQPLAALPAWARFALSGPEADFPIIPGAWHDPERTPDACLECLRDLPLLVARQLPLADCAAPMLHLAGCPACTNAAGQYARQLREARRAGEEQQLLRRWEKCRSLGIL